MLVRASSMDAILRGYELDPKVLAFIEGGRLNESIFSSRRQPSVYNPYECQAGWRALSVEKQEKFLNRHRNGLWPKDWQVVRASELDVKVDTANQMTPHNFSTKELT